MSRLYALMNAPDLPDGFVWLLPADGTQPVIVADTALSGDLLLDLLWSDLLSDNELALLAERGEELLAFAAETALAARVEGRNVR